MIRHAIGVGAIAVALVAAPLWASSQDTQSLGSVRLGRTVMANGQTLAAGTYTVRESSTAVSSVVGQAPDGAAWVEFVQDGQVRGRELATVLSGEAVGEVAKSGAPASGNARVELLRGGEYLRVWMNAGGRHYLIHFSVSAP